MEPNHNPKPSLAKSLLDSCEAKAQSLARLVPASFLPLEPRESPLEKEDLLAAEVTLPLDPACDLSRLRSVKMRRPYALHAELVLVDVSRLPAA